MKKIRLGILGFGNIGKVHADNIIGGKCPSVELSAICDLKEARLEEAKEKAPNAKLFTSYEEMLKSGEIDSVLIAVPHYDHPKFAIMAMQSGIHTLVEKPAGVYTKQVKEMNEIAKGCDVVFGLMMNQRTNCIYRKMREIVKSGELGEIRRTNLIITDWYRPQIYYNSGDWRATWSGEGGGVLLNQCPHNLDLWQWICGMPSKIEAKLHFGKWHDIEVEDDVSAYCEYPNGATGVFVTTTGDTPGTNRFEITFEKGKLLAENNKLTMWKNVMSEPEFSRTNDNPFARPDFEVIDVETDGENPQHSGVLNAFADAILNGGELIARGEEGINGLTISNAMHLSAWTGKAVDLTNFDDELFYEELSKRIKTSKRKTEVVEVGTVDMNSSFVKDHYHTK
jgi:predicted dehydrogenase